MYSSVSRRNPLWCDEVGMSMSMDVVRCSHTCLGVGALDGLAESGGSKAEHDGVLEDGRHGDVI